MTTNDPGRPDATTAPGRRHQGGDDQGEPHERGTPPSAAMSGPRAVQLQILDPRLGREIPLPGPATPGAAGMDLRACLDAERVVAPGESVLVPTGLAMHIAVGSPGTELEFAL